MNGWKALRNRLSRLDGIRADQELLAKLLRERVDTAEISEEEWRELAALRHKVREGDGDAGPGVSEEEWAELERLHEVARRARS